MQQGPNLVSIALGGDFLYVIYTMEFLPGGPNSHLTTDTKVATAFTAFLPTYLHISVMF